MDCWRNGVEWIPLIIITVFIGSNPLFTVIILLLLFCLSGAWTFFVELIMEWENSEFLNGIIDEAKEVNGAAPRGFVFSLFGLHSAGPLSRCFLHKRKETSFLLITEWMVIYCWPNKLHSISSSLHSLVLLKKKNKWKRLLVSFLIINWLKQRWWNGILEWVKEWNGIQLRRWPPAHNPQTIKLHSNASNSISFSIHKFIPKINWICFVWFHLIWFAESM